MNIVEAGDACAWKALTPPQQDLDRETNNGRFEPSTLGLGQRARLLLGGDGMGVSAAEGRCCRLVHEGYAQFRWTLGFRDPGVEREFWTEYARDSRRAMMIAAGIVMLMCFLLGLSDLTLDRLFAPGATATVARLRWFGAAPILFPALAVCLLASAPVFARWWQLFTALVTVTCGLFPLAVFAAVCAQFPDVVASKPAVASGLQLVALSNVLLTISVGHAVCRFAHATAVATVITVGYAVVVGGFGPPTWLSYNLFWLVVANAFGMATSYHLETSRRRTWVQDRLLRDERARSERLLLNMLPAAIAARLKEHEGRIADRFPEVTVLFGDIVGFTALSERLTPEQLVDTLDEVFSAFDALAEQHGVEKIKTIGDAYMVVGGLPIPRADHAQAIAEMALGMLEIVARRAPGLRMRIGIHTGPVVAGVIGKKKFSYDLWGDTVNTASRMESHGLDDTIQITEATHDRLGDLYDLEVRGVITVKGKGEMPTWWSR